MPTPQRYKIIYYQVSISFGVSPLRGRCFADFAYQMACKNYIFLASVCKFLREPHVGAKRAKHRAKRSPECGDPVGGTPK
jgi:hypothetical protein